MSILDLFLYLKKNSAFLAKKRLQIIISEKRSKKYIHTSPNYLPQLKKELLLVVSKYVKVNNQMITVHLEQKKKNISILKLNIIIPH